MNKKTVLLVDDQLSIRKAGKQILTKKGFDVVLAEDGEIALDLFKNQCFDLIILDYQMPNLNGMEVLIKVRAYPDISKSDTPILILSTVEDLTIIKKFTTNGANAFLQKKRLASTPEVFIEKTLTLTDQHEAAAPYKKEKLRKTVPDLIRKFHIFTNRMIQGYLTTDKVPVDDVEESLRYVFSEIEDGELFSLVYELVNDDDYLVTHTVNCSLLTMMFCRCYLHWDEEKVMKCTLGAFFHDFGYLDGEKPLFSSPSTLSQKEYEHYQDHVRRSVEIAKRIGLSEESINFIAAHHERQDGSGFPLKRNVSELGDIGEVAAIINCFDSLTFANKFHGKLQSHEAIQKMKEWDNQFSEFHLNHFASFTRQFDLKPHD